jgi:hypothetical protein
MIYLTMLSAALITLCLMMENNEWEIVWKDGTVV